MGGLAVVVSAKGKKLKAKIYVNGSYKGETNPKGELSIFDLDTDKEYIVRAETEDYKSEERKVVFKKDTMVQINFEME